MYIMQRNLVIADNKLQINAFMISLYDDNPGDENTETCQPGRTFMRDCNICKCSEGGLSAACTMKSCVPPQWFHKRGKMKCTSCLGGLLKSQLLNLFKLEHITLYCWLPETHSSDTATFCMS
jgi:hypothetical protein